MTTSEQITASPQITEIVLPGLAEPSGLRIRRRPLQAPAAGQALVQVEATGVSQVRFFDSSTLISGGLSH